MTSIIKVDTIQTSAGGTPTASSLGIGGTGKIGQVVSSTTSTSQYFNYITSYADIGLSVSITPTSTSSKILDSLYKLLLFKYQEQQVLYKIVRNSTQNIKR
jgi:hypothetical protein